MLLTVDIGNTNITLGGYIGNTLKFISRLNTDTSLTRDQYAVQILDVIKLHSGDNAKISDAIISSVVPSTLNAVAGALELITSKKPMIIGPGTKTGLNIKIDNPAQLGADLAVGAVGAKDKYPTPTIIIDMGTATTLSVIDKDGAFLGGVIAAGIRSTLDALASKTAQLPTISIEAPKSVIGKNTPDSMKSGLVLGAACLLDGMIDRIEDELGTKATVVATGGLAEIVVNACKKDIILDNNLLLEGLYKIYHKNK